MIKLNINNKLKKSTNFCLQVFILFISVSLYSNSSTIFVTSNTVFVNKSEISLDTKYINPLSTNIIYVEENTISTNLDSITNGVIVHNCKKTNQKVKVLAKKEKLTFKKEHKYTAIFKKKPIENDKLFVIDKLINLTIPLSNEKTNGIINENYKTNLFLYLQYPPLLNQIYLINFKCNYLKGIFRLRPPPVLY